MAKNKTINFLTVKVTYTVGLGNVKAPKDIAEQLMNVEGEEIDFTDERHSDLCDWVQNNIRERDCYHSSFEVQDISE